MREYLGPVLERGNARIGGLPQRSRRSTACSACLPRISARPAVAIFARQKRQRATLCPGGTPLTTATASCGCWPDRDTPTMRSILSPSALSCGSAAFPSRHAPSPVPPFLVAAKPRPHGRSETRASEPFCYAPVRRHSAHQGPPSVLVLSFKGHGRTSTNRATGCRQYRPLSCCRHVSRKVGALVNRGNSTHAAYSVHWTVGMCTIMVLTSTSSLAGGATAQQHMIATP